MMDFTRDELNLMMLYSPGDRPGLIRVLKKMRVQLVPEEVFLAELIDRVLEKLTAISDDAFGQIDLYAGMEGFNVG